MNYQNSLDNGLYLEDLKLPISWKVNQKELLEVLHNSKFDIRENVNFGYYGVSVKSRFLNSSSAAFITFNFVKEVLKSVNISFPLSENNLEQSFELTQRFLEDKLGKPINLNFFNFQGKKFQWKLKNIIITHELFESFSWRETLEISIR